MGYSSYTNDAAKALHDTATTRSTLDVKDYFVTPVGRAISTNEVPKEVNPLGAVVRESRDSEAHPKSKSIVVAFDTTGSMRHFPEIFATKALPNLMGLLIQKNLCPDAQVLFSAFNDGTTRAHPLQVGQFESGLEMDDDLTRLPLQGGGGGTMEESSEMILYWASRHTSMDCFEKRGEKGYLFILTDEMPYPTIDPQMVKDCIGDDIQGMTTEEAITLAREKFEIFCILANTGSYQGFYEEQIHTRWVQLLGAENVLSLQDAEGAAELIATTIGLYEGTIDVNNVTGSLTSHGIAPATVDAVVASTLGLSSKLVSNTGV